MRQVIHLEPDDDLAAIRSHLEWTEAQEVLLVVPRGCRVLGNLVNLKLLKRYANTLGLGVALVTNDSTTRVLAREVGFSVFRSLKRGQKARWRSLAPEVPAPLRGISPRGRAIPAPSAPRTVARALLALALTALLLLILLGAALLVIPGATITLVPATQTISETLEIQANPEITAINYERMQIPARVVERIIEGRAEAPPAARKDVPDARASGTVLFVNKRNEPTTIPQGTLVSTSAGTVIKFRTVEEVTLPPQTGGTARVGILAVDPGPSGNVKAWTINTVEPSLAFLANVVNDAPTSGGSVKRVGVVTAEDKKRLRESLFQRLQQEAANELQEELEEDEFLASESVTIEAVAEVFDQAVDELTESLSLRMRVRATGTAIPMSAADELASAFLESRVPDGFRLVPERFQVQPGQVTGIEGRKVRFQMNVSGLARAKVDEGDIKNWVRGRPIAEAERVLRQHLKLRGAPAIEVWPEWLERVPWLPFRIRIVIIPIS
ncbi:MAG: baseplate J/gp47 family protein [Anaerolineae bacterium]